MNHLGLRIVVFTFLFGISSIQVAQGQFGGNTLDPFVPAIGPQGSTPTIIRQINEILVSGYTDSILVIYRDDQGEIVATMQMRELSGQMYDVEQTIRLNGPSKTYRNVVAVNADYPIFQYSRINSFEQSALFVNFFHIMEDESGNQHLDAHWANKSPYVPTPGQKVYFVLTNSFNSGNEQTLSNMVFDLFSIDTYDAEPILPEAYITESHTFNNEINLIIDNKTDNVLEYTLETDLTNEGFVLADPIFEPITLQPGENEIKKSIGPFVTAQVTVINENDIRVDQIKTFDGGWISENQGIDTEDTFFSTQTCETMDQNQAVGTHNLENADNLLFSGCAIQRTTTENQSQIASLKRMIVGESGVQSLINYGSVLAHVTSTSDFKVCFERFHTNEKPCVDVEAVPSNDWVIINLENFLVEHDLDHPYILNDVQAISFIQTETGTHTMDVHNLIITTESLPSSYQVQTISAVVDSAPQSGNQSEEIQSNRGRGCASSQSNGWLIGLIFILWTMGWLIQRQGIKQA